MASHGLSPTARSDAPVRAEDDFDDGAAEAPALLRVIWADPQHMAEHLALWSLARFGPRADKAVEKLRRGAPDAGREELERLAVARQTRVAATEGAFVGGPFVFLIPVAFCAALLAQAQLVYELAALDGRSPVDRLRAAELLRVLGAYPTTDEAAAALDALPRTPTGKRLPRGTRVDAIRKMAYLLGLLGPADETRSRLRATVGWLGIGLLFLVGLVLPLVWVPYMTYSTRRSTLRLGARARRFYGSAAAADEPATATRLDAGWAAAFLRMTLLVLVPILAAIVALLIGGRWLGTGALLLVSALATLGWVAVRRRRHRRREP